MVYGCRDVGVSGVDNIGRRWWKVMYVYVGISVQWGGGV